MLAEQFPDHRIEIIDIWRLIKQKKSAMVINFLHFVKRYWSDILFKRMNPKAAFLRTEYLFNYVKELALQKSEQSGKIAFTFQLQSIFDTSVPGIPNFIYTDHTHLANLRYSQSGRVALYSAEWISLEKSIYENASMIFTRSTNISKSLVEQYGIAIGKVKCVYAGMNIPAQKNAAQGKDYKNQVVLFVGQDWKRKGGPSLLEAFHQIAPRYPNALLKIVGCEPKIDYPQIQVMGKIPLADLGGQFETASVFCMPSVNEPFGAVFVEAMAYELPIVATAIGAIPDIVKEGWNGYLVAPGDVAGLAIALEKLLSNPELCSRLGKNGKSLVDRDYNWTAVGEKIKKNIRQYLKEQS